MTDINDTCDCLEFARAWAHHPAFHAHMALQAEAMESAVYIIRDDNKRMRWAKCIRFLRWAEKTPAPIVASTTLTKAADIGWGLAG